MLNNPHGTNAIADFVNNGGKIPSLFDIIPEHAVRELWDAEASIHTKQWGAIRNKHKADLYNQFCTMANQNIEKLRTAHNLKETLRANIEYFIFVNFPVVAI